MRTVVVTTGVIVGLLIGCGCSSGKKASPDSGDSGAKPAIDRATRVSGPLVPSGARPVAPETAFGERITVSQNDVTVGFAGGVLRASTKVDAFRISRHPVTNRQLALCRSNSVCAAVDTPLTAAPESIALGVSVDDARALCGWLGGRLPQLSEWMLAARGAEIRRYAWGNEAPTCEQHPRGTRPSSSLKTKEPADLLPTTCDVPTEELLHVGKRLKGASPFGLEDVLLASGELVSGDPSGYFSACEDACIVNGLAPGAIDSVSAASQRLVLANDTKGEAAQEYGIRCVWAEDGR